MRESRRFGRYLSLGDGSTWPDPRAVSDLEWNLRYNEGGITPADLRVLASVCAAYIALSTRPDMRGKPAILRRAIRSTAGIPLSDEIR